MFWVWRIGPIRDTVTHTSNLKIFQEPDPLGTEQQVPDEEYCGLDSTDRQVLVTSAFSVI